MDFLGPYLVGIVWGWWGVIAAVLGVISFGEWVAGKQFPLKTRTRIYLLVAALILAQCAAYKVQFDRGVTEQSKAEIRSRLADYILSGQRLQVQLRRERDDTSRWWANSRPVGAWESRVCDYLSTALEPAYCVRFRAQGPQLSGNALLNYDHYALISAIDQRIAKIEEFLKEPALQR